MKFKQEYAAIVAVLERIEQSVDDMADATSKPELLAALDAIEEAAEEMVETVHVLRGRV